MWLRHTNQKTAGILSEDKIEKWIIPHLSKGKRGFPTKVSLTKIVLLILKRLKTGCQWRELSIREYFEAGQISWQSVYYYFNKWSKDGSFHRAWISLLGTNRSKLDLSSVQVDGSHTPCKRGGEAVGYQGRKSCNTSNSLFLCDNNGQMLSVSSPQPGEHNDLYDIVVLFKELIRVLQASDIAVDGLFLNADPGFDAASFRTACKDAGIEANIKENPRNKRKPDEAYIYFDEILYKRRTKIEHANAWMDSFKALLVRFETRANTWMALQWLAFIVMFTRKWKV